LCFTKNKSEEEEDFSNLLPPTGLYKTDAKIKQMQVKITRIIKQKPIAKQLQDQNLQTDA